MTSGKMPSLSSVSAITTLSGGGSVFNPLSVSGCKLWLDASDSDTITKDGSNLVSQWDDKSDEGNDISQATATNKPLWVDSVQNGLPIIRFNGSDNYIRRTTYVNGSLSQPNTFFVVCVMPDIASASTAFVFDGGTSREGFGTKLPASDDDFNMFAGIELHPTTTVDSTNFLQYTGVFNGASSLFRENQTQLFTGNTGSNAMDGITLGTAAGLDQFGNPDIAEILIYNADITGDDLTNIEQYLKDKWAV